MLPYIGNVSECIKRILTPFNIKTAFRPYKTLRDMLLHPKDIVAKNQKSGTVYKITCRDYEKVYVGQTGRFVSGGLDELSSPQDQHHSSGTAN